MVQAGPLFGQSPRERLGFVGFAALLAAALIWLCFHQGLTWDEPWLMAQAQLLAGRGTTAAYKPLAGVLLLPLRATDAGWLWGRGFFLVLQLALGWALWQLMPRAWGRTGRGFGLALLWLEPTFRERVLEMRTDSACILLVLAATLVWHRDTRLARTGSVALLAASLALAPKAMLWIVPWFIVAWLFDGARKGYRKAFLPVVSVALLCGALAALAWAAAARWTGRHFLDLVHTSASTNSAALATGSFVNPATVYYLKQVVLLGLPFYLVAILGLFDLVRHRDRDVSPWAHWQWTGLAGALATPLYAGAFPYHYVGVIAGLLPLAMRGLASLRPGRRPWTGWAVLGCSVLFAGYSATAVLEGPTFRDQMQAMAFAKSFLQPGMAYVDGVGMLEPPQCAPFVTSQAIHLGQAQGLWRQWETQRAGLFILNGRTEALFSDPGNAEWAKAYLVRVHPLIAVVGISGTKTAGPVDRAWTCPFDLTLQLTAAPGTSWRLNGKPITPGQAVAVRKGLLQFHGDAGTATPFLLSAPGAKTAPPLDASIPFFLPFQRL